MEELGFHPALLVAGGAQSGRFGVGANGVLQEPGSLLAGDIAEVFFAKVRSLAAMSPPQARGSQGQRQRGFVAGVRALGLALHVRSNRHRYSAGRVRTAPRPAETRPGRGAVGRLPGVRPVYHSG